jgi:hypothetical protein
MKKLVYIVLISIATSMTIVSCTEESITPSTEFNGGGGPLDPK